MLGTLTGVFRLSQDVELRYLPSGSPLAKLNLVNSDKYKTQSGEQKEETCFIDGAIFGKMAEVANQYLKKGSKVFIVGKLKQDSWTAQDGTNRTRHSVKIESFEMLDNKKDTQGNNQNNNYNQQGNSNGYNQSQQNSYNNQQQYKIPEIDINEDSIPF